MASAAQLLVLFSCRVFSLYLLGKHAAAAAAKSLQSCPTLCNPIDGSPRGFPVPGILQARTLEWVAISFSNAWKWKVKWRRSVISDSSRPHGLQPTRLLCPWDFPGMSTGVGCHCFLQGKHNLSLNSITRLPHKWAGSYTAGKEEEENFKEKLIFSQAI